MSIPQYLHVKLTRPPANMGEILNLISHGKATETLKLGQLRSERYVSLSCNICGGATVVTVTRTSPGISYPPIGRDTDCPRDTEHRGRSRWAGRPIGTPERREWRVGLGPNMYIRRLTKCIRSLEEIMTLAENLYAKPTTLAHRLSSKILISWRGLMPFVSRRRCSLARGQPATNDALVLRWVSQPSVKSDGRTRNFSVIFMLP